MFQVPCTKTLDVGVADVNAVSVQAEEHVAVDCLQRLLVRNLRHVRCVPGPVGRPDVLPVQPVLIELDEWVHVPPPPD